MKKLLLLTLIFNLSFSYTQTADNFVPPACKENIITIDNIKYVTKDQKLINAGPGGDMYFPYNSPYRSLKSFKLCRSIYGGDDLLYMDLGSGFGSYPSAVVFFVKRYVNIFEKEKGLVLESTLIEGAYYKLVYDLEDRVLRFQYDYPGAGEFYNNYSITEKFYWTTLEEDKKKLDKAIELDPNNSGAYRDRGNFKNSKLKDYKGAIEDHNKAIELDPENSGAYRDRGDSKYNLDDLNGACADWIKAASLGDIFALKYAKKYCGDEVDVEASLESSMTGKGYMERATSRHYRKFDRETPRDFKGAISDYTKCIELGYKVRQAYINRAIAKESLNDYIGAIADYTKSIDEERVAKLIRSGNPTEIYRITGDLKKEKLKDYLGAIEDYTKIIEWWDKISVKYDEVTGTYQYAFADIAELKYLLGDLNSACGYWRKSLLSGWDDREDKPSVSNRLKNKCGDDVGDNIGWYVEVFDDSLSVFSQKKLIDYLGSRANRKYIKKNYEGAIKDLMKILYLDPDNKSTLLWIGYNKSELKDYEGAIAAYKKVLELNPDDKNAKRELNKVMPIYKTLLEEKNINDKEIGIELNEIINKGHIISLPIFRNTINNDVFSNELKNKYLNILENKITSFNDSIISLFTIELENKKKESLVSHMKSLVEYGNLDSLQNKINDKFELDKPLSFINTEQFREYLVDFIINRLTDGETFGIPKSYESNAISFQFYIKLKEGKIKTDSAWGFLDGQTLDYNLSEDEKEQIETFTFFNISSQTQSINIEAEAKLVKQNQTFIHNKKEPKTLYVNKNLLNADERSIFTGVNWKPNKIFFKKRSNSSESENLSEFTSQSPITTKTFKSQKNQIKLNLDDTYGIKVKESGYEDYLEGMFENLNSYFNSTDTNKKIRYFSDDKKIVNVYNEWVYELYIGNKKVNKNIKVKFTGLTPLRDLTKPTYYNKPFYTISVYQVY